VCRRIGRPELEEQDVAWREDQANRLLYAADPDYACSLGYVPPPVVDPERAHLLFERAVRRWNQLQLSSTPQLHSGRAPHGGSTYISVAFGAFH
jgi:hypothetical protein